MALHVPPLIQTLQSDAELEALLCTKGLKVVELYSEWCGSCKSVVPTFRRIRLDKDDEAALLFISVGGTVPRMQMPSDKCEFLEAAKEQRGKSEPLFLLYRNGQLKCRIEGADTPTLSEQIMAFTPANADLDDLEENPMYLARAEKQRVLRGEVVRDNKSGKKGKK
ncbi:hypothetical protein QJQ45_022359 [Haematococcus lacustris]|nr:hypothetical protein QJQ45_022359 [Haematococcus lacustris]